MFAALFVGFVSAVDVLFAIENAKTIIVLGIFVIFLPLLSKIGMGLVNLISFLRKKSEIDPIRK